MGNDWRDLTFLHWSYEPKQVQRLLPPGLTVETFEGRAWVALVPFSMRVNLPRLPSIPWVTRYPETNVRTYVVGPDGSTAVWFLSLDASNLPAVLTGRLGYRVPYHWSRVKVTRLGEVLTYETTRFVPGPLRARSELVARIGTPFAADELTAFDHWLTARWQLFGRAPGRRAADLAASYIGADAEHVPWPLHRLEVLHLRDELVAAAGLPAPRGEPVAHFSPAVHVRIGLPRKIHPACLSGGSPGVRR
jgi:uncharacterized protein YqjF (DUF2071 family)